MPLSIIGNTDAAGIGDPFKTGGDVDAIAKDVVVIDDDVADMNSDPKFDSLVLWHSSILLCHAGLDLDCAPCRIDRACKFNQKAVACRFNDPPPMLLDFEIDDGFSDGLQSG